MAFADCRVFASLIVVPRSAPTIAKVCNALGFPFSKGLQLRDLKQLIELAKANERDPTTLDRAKEIYEQIINEHDYSHYSTMAAAALDRIEQGETEPARIRQGETPPAPIAKLEGSQVERVLFRLAILFYVASLVLPVDGHFFAGLVMLVLSFIGSVWAFPEAVSRIPGDPGAAFGLISLLIMPFYNIFFLVALTRFWEAGRLRFSVFRIGFYTCTVHSLVWSAIALFTHVEKFYISGLWAAAFLFLSLAVAICTEKNLTRQGTLALVTGLR